MDTLKRRSSSFKIIKAGDPFKKIEVPPTPNPSPLTERRKSSPRPCSTCGGIKICDCVKVNRGSARMNALVCPECVMEGRLRSSSSGDSSH